jgi:hypothetical protein
MTCIEELSGRIPTGFDADTAQRKDGSLEMVGSFSITLAYKSIVGLESTWIIRDLCPQMLCSVSRPHQDVDREVWRVEVA